MDYVYTAYTNDRRLVKGKLNASNIETANRMLNYGGYQVVTLKPSTSFLSSGAFSLTGSGKVNLKDVLMFSRQLALLLESGTDLVNSLELLQKQMTVKNLKKILEEVVRDIRGGGSFSSALSKHTKVFPSMYIQSIAAGEQAGNIDVVLRQVSDYMERDVVTRKKIRGAMTYPIVTFVLAIVVVAVLSIFVMPVFTSLFSSFGATLPLATRILIGVSAWAKSYILYVLGILLVIAAVIYAYVRTPNGRLWWDTLMLRVPIIGRIAILNELSRCCRTMSLLFKVGMPLPEIMGQTVRGATNKAFSNALTEVQQELIKGEGLSKPMSRSHLFLPLMVQMVSVGEETGNLDNALTTVAISYETESDDRTSAAVGLIQPVMTIAVALVIGFVAVAMVSAMYGVYGQIKL